MDETEDVRDAIEELFSAILRENVDAIQQHYLQEDRLFIFRENWEGKIEGFDRRTHASLWQGLLDQVTFSKIELTDDVRAGRNGELGWVGGTIASTYTPSDGSTPVNATQSATWVLERIHARWVIVFEQVSLTKEEPGGGEALSS